MGPVFVPSTEPTGTIDDKTSYYCFTHVEQKGMTDSAHTDTQLLALLLRIDQLLALRSTQYRIHDVLEKGVRLISEALAVGQVTLFQIFEKHQEILLESKIVWSETHEVHQDPARSLSSMERSGIGQWRHTLASGNMIVCSSDDLTIDEQLFLAKHGCSSALLVPVFTEGSWWGFLLNGETKARGHWDDTAVLFTKIIADLIGCFLHIENMRIGIDKHNEELFELTHARDNFAKENADLKNWKEQIFRSFMNEFRSPINSLIGFASTLRDNEQLGADPEIRKICLGNINEQSQILEKLVQKLLFISNQQVVLTTRDFHPVDLRFISLELTTLFQQRCDKQSIKFISSIASSPMIVLSEQALLRQMLFNLLDNSLRETPESGWLSFSTGASETEVCIRITHSPGHTPEKQRSYKIENSSPLFTEDFKSNYLSITKRTVDLHRGTLTIESDETTGTALIIILPRTMKSTGL